MTLLQIEANLRNVARALRIRGDRDLDALAETLESSARGALAMQAKLEVLTVTLREVKGGRAR